jgi:hypothetical protein
MFLESALFWFASEVWGTFEVIPGDKSSLRLLTYLHRKRKVGETRSIVQSFAELAVYTGHLLQIWIGGGTSTMRSQVICRQSSTFKQI